MINEEFHLDFSQGMPSAVGGVDFPMEPARTTIVNTSNFTLVSIFRTWNVKGESKEFRISLVEKIS